MRECKREDVPIGAVFRVNSHPGDHFMAIGQIYRKVTDRVEHASVPYFLLGNDADEQHPKIYYAASSTVLVTVVKEYDSDNSLSQFPIYSFKLFYTIERDELATAYINEMILDEWTLESVAPHGDTVAVLMTKLDKF